MSKSDGEFCKPFLVADIGGTNSRLGYAENGQVNRGSIKRFLNREFSCFENIVRKFRSDIGNIEFECCCVAVAGPVEPRRASLTNIDWTIEIDSLSNAAECGTAKIINDLTAIGFGLNMADSRDVHLVCGRTEPHLPSCLPSGKQLVVNVGTGFNTALVIGTSSGPIVSDAECGRVTLPVRSELEHDFKLEIERLNGYAGIEDALSGRGVEAIHNWICRSNPTASPQSRIEHDSGFLKTVEWEKTGRILTGILGTVVGDLALHHLPNDGIYLVGGVVRGLAPHLLEFGFESAFRRKGDYSEFMRRFSVSVVTDDYLALKGCAAFSLAAD